MDAQTKKFFTPAWFGALFRGEHALGDTFWGGAFGVQLIFLPIWLAAEFLIQITLPTLEPIVFLISMLFFCAYSLLLTRAIFGVAKRSPKAGGWRWVGVLYCALSTVLFAKLLLTAISDIVA